MPVEKRMKHSNYQTFCQPTMVIQNLFNYTYQSFLILRDQHYHPLHSIYLHDISPPWRWINTRLLAVVSLLTALPEDAYLPSLYHHRINLSLWIDEERILVNHSCIGSIYLFSVIFLFNICLAVSIHFLHIQILQNLSIEQLFWYNVYPWINLYSVQYWVVYICLINADRCTIFCIQLCISHP